MNLLRGLLVIQEKLSLVSVPRRTDAKALTRTGTEHMCRCNPTSINCLRAKHPQRGPFVLP